MSPSPRRAAGEEDTPLAVTVVVVTYNSADVIGDCLRSLPAALEGVEHEVVVADNASADDTLAVAATALPGATLLPTGGNIGYSAAINAGVDRVGPRDAVLVLNPDVRLAPGSVAIALRRLRGDVGIVVPVLRDEHGARQRSQRREPTVRRALAEAVLGGNLAARLGTGELVADGEPYTVEGDVDWATGAVMLVATACLDDVGPFDESFFLYSEETDFMLRARDAGWSTRFVPEFTAVHIGGELTTSPRLWSLSVVNRVRLHRRRHGRASTAAFVAVSLTGEGIRAVRGAPTCRRAFRDLLSAAPGLVLGPAPAIEPTPPGWISFSAHDWWYFSRAHSDFQLMQRVAQRRPVLFVNSIGLRMPTRGRSTNPMRRILRKARSLGRYVRTPVPEIPGFHVMTPLPFPVYGSERSRRFGTWLVRTQVAVVARWLGITGPGRPDPVILVTLPTAIGAARSLPHSALVINRSDKHSAFGEADGDSIALLEEECLRHGDRVFYTAVSLREDEAELAGDRARDLDHGVDVDLFAPSDAPLPDDLAAIPGPRVGFFGSVRDHLVDLSLLEAVARELPDVQLVLVGPVASAPERVAALEAMPNVHFLGARPYEEIPDYGRGFDVALMPWHENEWMRYANPIKLKEYLALGLPVVSTDFPEVHRYADTIRIASDRAEFVAAVEKTLADGGLLTPALRREAVVGSTWDAAGRYLLRESERAARRTPSA